MLLRGSKDSFSNIESVGCTASVTSLSIFYDLQKTVLLAIYDIVPKIKDRWKIKGCCFRRFILRFIFTETASSDKFELAFFHAAYLPCQSESDFVMIQFQRVIWSAAQNLSSWNKLAPGGTNSVGVSAWAHHAPDPLWNIHVMISDPLSVLHSCCDLFLWEFLW